MPHLIVQREKLLKVESFESIAQIILFFTLSKSTKLYLSLKGSFLYLYRYTKHVVVLWYIIVPNGPIVYL